MISSSPDLDIAFEDLMFHGDFQMQLTATKPMVELHYCLQGTRVIHIAKSAENQLLASSK